MLLSTTAICNISLRSSPSPFIFDYLHSYTVAWCPKRIIARISRLASVCCYFLLLLFLTLRLHLRCMARFVHLVRRERKNLHIFLENICFWCCFSLVVAVAVIVILFIFISPVVFRDYCIYLKFLYYFLFFLCNFFFCILFNF